jgi:hypothetical protein
MLSPAVLPLAAPSDFPMRILGFTSLGMLKQLVCQRFHQRREVQPINMFQSSLISNRFYPNFRPGYFDRGILGQLKPGKYAKEKVLLS